MPNSNIYIQNHNENDKANHYENIAEVELQVKQEDVYQSQVEYVVHENNPDEIKSSQNQKYDNNNIYLHQIPKRNKCSVRIEEGDTYEHENKQVSENPNQVFVTLAKRKSHGIHVSYFMQLYKSCICQKCLWIALGFLLTILLISAIFTGYYLSSRNIESECTTSNVTHFTVLRGFNITINSLASNRKCIFPFKYKEKLYHNCTNDYACQSCYWCGTQFNVSFYSGWGLCNKSCPMESSNLEKTTKAPPKCVDKQPWCKKVPKKNCDNNIYDYDLTRDDLYKDVCKKSCNNC